MPPPAAPQLSVVSPVYHGRDSVAELVRRIRGSLAAAAITHEIILVDDACPMDSWSVIRGLCAGHPEVKAIRLARNVGQHRALREGLIRCRGEFAAVIDCDLEDDPAFLPAMLAKAREGYGVVYARRRSREDPLWRRAGARLFYRAVSVLSGRAPIDPLRGMYTVLSASALRELLARQGPRCRYLLTLDEMAAPSADVEVVRSRRPSGSSGYRWTRLARLALEGILDAGRRRDRRGREGEAAAAEVRETIGIGGG